MNPKADNLYCNLISRTSPDRQFKLFASILVPSAGLILLFDIGRLIKHRQISPHIFYIAPDWLLYFEPTPLSAEIVRRGLVLDNLYLLIG